MPSVVKHFISLKPSYVQYDRSRFVDKEISNHMQVKTQALNKNIAPAMRTN